MSDIVDLIKSMPDFIGANGRTEEEIIQAEKELGVSFARDYRKYLENIGLACFDGRELTGLTKTTRLDVVSVTKEHMPQIGEYGAKLYVIEETGIDGIVIWQDADGIVYESAPNSKARRIASSLAEYIER